MYLLCFLLALMPRTIAIGSPCDETFREDCVLASLRVSEHALPDCDCFSKPHKPGLENCESSSRVSDPTSSDFCAVASNPLMVHFLSNVPTQRFVHAVN